MKIAIRNSERYGQRVKKLIDDNFNFEVVCYVQDINSVKYGEKGGIPIVSQYAAIQMYNDHKIDKFIIPGNLKIKPLKEIEKELINFDVSQEDIIVVPIDLMNKDSDKLAEEEKERLIHHNEFNYLEYLEFHVVDHCNLNCCNCSHFAPLVKQKELADYVTVKNDFIRLKQLVEHIGKIRIMGGECLLNPELGKYVKMVREIYPYTELVMVTNGLLIEQMSDDLIETLKEKDVCVNISSYKPLWKRIDRIVNYLQEKELIYRITEPIFTFGKVMDLEQKIKFPYQSLEGLESCYCKNLYKGKLAICPTVCYSHYYSEYFNDNRIDSFCKGGTVDIYQVDSYEQMRKVLDKPCAMCNYCQLYRERGDKNATAEWKQFAGDNYLGES